MVPVHIREFGAEIGRREELIDRWVNQHAGGVDAGLVAEYVEPDAWLRRLHGNAAHLLEMSRELAQPLVLEARDLDAEQVTELHQHLVHRSVAGALTDAVDTGREHLCP